MFKTVTPESVGISSAKVQTLVRTLEEKGLATHSVILARGDKVFAETYFTPFNADFRHRLYSVSKSFIAMAIGFMIQDGHLKLEDKLVDFFPEYVEGNPAVNQHLRDTTIYDLLTMQTCHVDTPPWIEGGVTDRLSLYFAQPAKKVPGSIWKYDSPGSFMLCAIVERISGKPYLDYLKEKVLLDIGFTPDAVCVQAPGGHSFGDSGILCTSRDLLAFARFVLNGGTWEGKRYLNEKFMKDAVSYQACNSASAVSTFDGQGYGYLIWRTPHDTFSFIGMGDQLAICHPKTDCIMIITSDNQDKSAFTREVIFNALWENVLSCAEDTLPEDELAYGELQKYLSTRKLFCLTQNPQNPFKEEINGVTYTLEENPMGISNLRFTFEGNRGVLSYKNTQGEKELAFGLGENVFSKFPQEGYSDLIASVPCPGNRYDCAASADWPEPRKLRIKVQAIDKYFGNLNMLFKFKGGEIAVSMEKCAEAFFNEYHGDAAGKRVDA